MTTITETHLAGARLSRRGKVRELYDLGDSSCLSRATASRRSTWSSRPGSPTRDKILTQLSNFWFRKFADVENHLLETDVARFPEELQADAPLLAGRSVHRPQVRGHPVRVRGARLPRRLRLGRVPEDRRTSAGSGCPRACARRDRLPEPIFTPATKAETGHDENVSLRHDGAALCPPGEAERLRDLTLSLYPAPPSTPRRAG